MCSSVVRTIIIILRLQSKHGIRDNFQIQSVISQRSIDYRDELKLKFACVDYTQKNDFDSSIKLYQSVPWLINNTNYGISFFNLFFEKKNRQKVFSSKQFCNLVYLSAIWHQTSDFQYKNLWIEIVNSDLMKQKQFVIFYQVRVRKSIRP